MNTTVRIKASEIYKDWHVIDAAGRPLGRVATEAATLLRGKHKPTYEPHLDDGDFVIVINASQVRVTGRKAEQIKYYSHSGYPGGLKTRSYEDQLARFPERVLEKAIWGMLPGGPLGEKMFKHLKVYKSAHHPHQSQLIGSQKAKEAREEAQKAQLTEPRKAPRLRPVSVPQVLVEREAKVPTATPMRPASSTAAKTRRGKAPKEAAEATTRAEMLGQDDTVLSDATPPPAQAVTVDGETTVDYGTPTPAEAAITAETTPAEAKAPSAETEAEGEAAAAPKPRARRKAADTEATAGADASAEAKPARRRSAKTEE
jgi:large subunit ribosomal protein L13